MLQRAPQCAASTRRQCGVNAVRDVVLRLVKDILKKAFCDTIPAGSIVENSCVLQLLSYNPETGAADYIITFAIVEQDTLEAALADTNNNIAAVIAQNPDVPDAIKNSVQPGTISKCIC